MAVATRWRYLNRSLDGSASCAVQQAHVTASQTRARSYIKVVNSSEQLVRGRHLPSGSSQGLEQHGPRWVRRLIRPPTRGAPDGVCVKETSASAWLWLAPAESARG